MRIYVPAGSELLETSGFTAMTIAPQIDYVKERFVVDEDLVASERAARIDASGMRIFEESGKTVFGGWVTVGRRMLRPLSVTGCHFRLQEMRRPHRWRSYSKTTSVSANSFFACGTEGRTDADGNNRRFLPRVLPT